MRITRSAEGNERCTIPAVFATLNGGCPRSGQGIRLAKRDAEHQGGEKEASRLLDVIKNTQRKRGAEKPY